jgi:SAM-dependent methyltransferase
MRPESVPDRLRSLLVRLLGRQEGPRRIPVPPKHLKARIGRGDYDEVGREFFAIFTGKAGLTPSARVLDVGCGAGRMAVHLGAFLRPPGHYEGFDVDADLVSWCQEHISSVYPHVRFRHVDIESPRYNPGGRRSGPRFTFPYETRSFDFVVTISVFTHLVQGVLERYVSEISRVLAPGGTLVTTFFLLNEETGGLLAEGKARLAFGPKTGVCSLLKPDAPESAIAYDEVYVRQLFGRHHLGIVEPVLSGSWCGRKSFLSYQDIVIAKRVATGPHGAGGPGSRECW